MYSKVFFCFLQSALGPNGEFLLTWMDRSILDDELESRFHCFSSSELHKDSRRDGITNQSTAEIWQRKDAENVRDFLRHDAR